MPSKGSFPSPPSSLVAFVASARTRMILRAGERRITRERFLVGRALTRENARASSARAVDVAPTRVTSPRGALERIVSEGETSSVDEGAGTRRTQPIEKWVYRTSLRVTFTDERMKSLARVDVAARRSFPRASSRETRVVVVSIPSLRRRQSSSLTSRAILSNPSTGRTSESPDLDRRSKLSRNSIPKAPASILALHAVQDGLSLVVVGSKSTPSTLEKSLLNSSSVPC